MLCSMCHKNEAVICYTEIVNGVKKEQYLCPECAAKYTAFDADAPGLTPGSLLAGLLTSVLGQAGVTREDDSKKTNLVCKNCGMTYNEFLKYSKFGCSECVHTFGFLLDDYLKKIQGSCEHCGKVYPGRETVIVPELSFMDQKPGGGSSQNDTGRSDRVENAGGPADPGTTAADKTGADAGSVPGSVPGSAATAGSVSGSAVNIGSGAGSAANAGSPATAVSPEDPPQIAALKRQLSAAIKAEEYEEAARIRDAIRTMQSGEAAAQTRQEVTVDEKMV